MSSTRSTFRPAPATELVLVSHGSPSDPAPQEAFIRDLAAKVAARSGWKVRGATLAMPGSLDDAVKGLTAPRIFPHFMADGWFVSTNLPKRLAKAGLSDWTTLAPLGMTPGLPGLAGRRIAASMEAAGLPRGATTLVVAAHGSPSDPRPARATRRFSEALRGAGLFSEIRIGYVDEDPALADAAAVRGPAVLLPFFAAEAGHVLIDLPEAIEAAGYAGTVLPPIGTWDEIPDLITQALEDRAGAA